ncbi:MAG TPA: ParA family partition ATPase, partial [Acetobacteraceae bacterium]|nr:ParA family partition ATPase [Acetobacteraceae bacterium]
RAISADVSSASRPSSRSANPKSMGAEEHPPARLGNARGREHGAGDGAKAPILFACVRTRNGVAPFMPTPRVITIAQQKGGTGKTLLAANLAASFAASVRVAAIDADPQGTLSRWAGLRQAKPNAASLTCVEAAVWRLGAELDRLLRAHAVVVIDSPPRIDTEARVAIRAADLVLVPVQPSLPDLWAAEGTLALAATERRASRVVLNRVPATPSRIRALTEAALVERRLPCLRAALGNRTGFALAFAEGLSVTEYAPRSAAAAELRALIEEVRELTA